MEQFASSSFTFHHSPFTIPPFLRHTELTQELDVKTLGKLITQELTEAKKKLGM